VLPAGEQKRKISAVFLSKVQGLKDRLRAPEGADAETGSPSAEASPEPSSQESRRRLPSFFARRQGAQSESGKADVDAAEDVDTGEQKRKISAVFMSKVQGVKDMLLSPEGADAQTTSPSAEASPEEPSPQENKRRLPSFFARRQGAQSEGRKDDVNAAEDAGTGEQKKKISAVFLSKVQGLKDRLRAPEGADAETGSSSAEASPEEPSSQGNKRRLPSFFARRQGAQSEGGKADEEAAEDTGEQKRKISAVFLSKVQGLKDRLVALDGTDAETGSPSAEASPEEPSSQHNKLRLPGLLARSQRAQTDKSISAETADLNSNSTDGTVEPGSQESVVTEPKRRLPAFFARNRAQIESGKADVVAAEDAVALGSSADGQDSEAASTAQKLKRKLAVLLPRKAQDKKASPETSDIENQTDVYVASADARELDALAEELKDKQGLPASFSQANGTESVAAGDPVQSAGDPVQSAVSADAQVSDSALQASGRVTEKQPASALQEQRRRKALMRDLDNDFQVHLLLRSSV
jgi:hypothetical protein